MLCRICILLFLPTLLNAQIKAVKHVILIGVDGMGANYLPDADIPTMTMMMHNGSYTLHARCVSPSSSADNWAAMTMGASPELTGYTEWNSKTPEIPSRVTDQYQMFPSIFTLLREQKPQSEIGVVYEWGGIESLFPKAAVNKEAHCEGDSLTAQTAIQYIKESKPTFLFIHFSSVDGAGHSIGWGTPAYYQAIHETDTRIQAILQSIEDAGISDQTIVLVTADHGGIQKGHGGKTLQEMEIPWIIYGKRIKPGQELQESIMTFDTAATLAFIFGLKPPQVWIGRPVKAAFNYPHNH